MLFIRYIRTSALAILLAVSTNVHSSNFGVNGERMFYNSLMVEAFNEINHDESSVVSIIEIKERHKAYKVNLEDQNKYFSGKNTKKCIAEFYQSGLSMIIRPIFYGDVYIEAEITIFNKEDVGKTYIRSSECGSIEKPNIKLSSEQKLVTLILDTPYQIELHNRVVSFFLTRDKSKN